MSDSCTTLPEHHQTPIFILGILPRCGTNFLYDLLTAHPDCAPAEPVWEDFLLYHADQLSNYTQTVFGSWNPKWGVTADLQTRLLAHLGTGLSQFLTERAGGKRAVTKTPRTDHLQLFYQLFPGASLIILIRDGRSVVESGVQSFGWYRESANRHYARSAERIMAFQQGHSPEVYPYCVVRYEDLWTHQEAELRKIFNVVGLDAGLYDFEQAAGLPVRGSSTVKDSRQALHWKPVEKPKDFDPMKRFCHWGWFRHQRFNHLTGKFMTALGYEIQEGSRNGSTRWLFKVVNLVLDMGWPLLRSAGSMMVKLKGRTYRPPD